MSLQEIMATPHDAPPTLPLPSDPKGPIRSWRKKFRKMKLRFDKKMDESSALYREEQHAMVIAKRLQEQNDQLLELLLDVNESMHIPPELRYNLRGPPQSEAADVSPGNHVPRPLGVLEKLTLHTRPSPSSTSLHPELTSEAPLGYFSPAHEEDYLAALDHALQAFLTPEGYDVNNPLNNDGRPLIRANDRAREMTSDKEVALKNPMSVTNWLRRNQPEVFLQDKYEERTSAKASRQAAAAEAAAAGGGAVAAPGGQGSRSKRGSLVSLSTPIAGGRGEEEMLDDESGFYHETGRGSGRGNKRSKEDEPYRPKGGSNRPSKRKRESIVGEGVSRKKSRASVATTEDGHED